MNVNPNQPTEHRTPLTYADLKRWLGLLVLLIVRRDVDMGLEIDPAAFRGRFSGGDGAQPDRRLS